MEAKSLSDGSLGQEPEPAKRVPAAFEYVRQMRLCLGKSAAPEKFIYWKRLFGTELARAREQEKLRMARSGDWSGLGRYVEDSWLVRRHLIALDTAGLLSHWQVPGAFRLFETSVAAILETVFGMRRR